MHFSTEKDKVLTKEYLGTTTFLGIVVFPKPV